MLPDLMTNRLVLRELQLEDGPVLQDYESRPEHVQCQATEPEEYVDGTMRIKRYLEHRGTGVDRRLFVYVALCRETDVIVGQFGLSRFHPKSASLGFSIASPHWGYGYATEVAARAIEYGFDVLELHRISADVAVENEPCRRVMEKIRMVQEGIARDCMWAQDRWWTEAKYAILCTDPREA